MYVGFMKVKIFFEGISSIKERRRVLRMILDRARSSWNVSAAEEPSMERELGVLAFVTVSDQRDVVEKRLDAIEEMVHGCHGFPVLEVSREVDGPW